MAIPGNLNPFINPDFDFNGDGRTDILWRNFTTGENIVWLMDGNTLITGASLPTVDPATGVWLPGTGEFNGDGKTDILWRNSTTGETAVWLMDGTTPITGASLGVVDPTTWDSSIAEFNGDGKTDLLWRNLALTPGPEYQDPALLVENVVWLIDGTTITATGTLPTLDLVAGAWESRVAEFNGDRKTDIIWRNFTTGENVVWLMDGTTVIAGAYLPTLDPLTGAWDFSIAEFNGDGKTDLLWRNYTTGENLVWVMDGTTPVVGASLPTLDPITGYWLSGVAEFNGDGKTDLLWHNYTTGENVVWLMDGTTAIAGASLPTLEPGTGAWDFNIAEFNGDGKTDILWRNSDTGENLVWLMDGTTPITGASLPTLIDWIPIA